MTSTSRWEWPSQNAQLLVLLSKIIDRKHFPTTSAKHRAIEILDIETAKCDRDGGVPCDIGIFDHYPSDRNREIAMVLTALYYRSRIQSVFLKAFLTLVQRGLVSINALRKPITLGRSSPSSFKVSCLLRTFEMIVKEEEYEGQEVEQHPFDLWRMEPAHGAMDWLATMIIRGCKDFYGAFDAIEASGFLGDVNEAAFEEYAAEHNKPFACDPQDRVPTTTRKEQDNEFGFWLPYGLGNAPEAEIHAEIAARIEQYREIGRAWKDFFSLWDDWSITPDRTQAKGSDLIPRYYECPF